MIKVYESPDCRGVSKAGLIVRELECLASSFIKQYSGRALLIIFLRSMSYLYKPFLGLYAYHALYGVNADFNLSLLADKIFQVFVPVQSKPTAPTRNRSFMREESVFRLNTYKLEEYVSLRGGWRLVSDLAKHPNGTLPNLG